MTTTYAFQDYLRLEIHSGGRRRYERWLDNEYLRINETRVESGEPRRVVRFHVVDEIPELPDDAIVRSARFKKLFTFHYAVSSLGEHTTDIWFVDHPVSRLYTTAVGVFVQAHVIEPVMYRTLLDLGVLFMHSAGVSRDGQAFVFPAHGGTGKTTLSMALLEDGFQFMGDDLLLVDPERGRVYPYPRPLHLFTYNVRNIRNSKIPKGTVAAIYAKNGLRFFLERILRTEFLIATRIHADEVIEGLELSPAADLHHVVFLIKEGSARRVALDPENVTEHATAIIDSADLNDSLAILLDDAEATRAIRKTEVEVATEILRAASGFGYLNTRAIELQDAATLIVDLDRL